MINRSRFELYKFTFSMLTILAEVAPFHTCMYDFPFFAMQTLKNAKNIGETAEVDLFGPILEAIWRKTIFEIDAGALRVLGFCQTASRTKYKNK